MNKKANVKPGEIYAIPLFLSNEKDTKNFSRNKFEDKGEDFVFCRVIEDLYGGGILIEIFNLVSSLNVNIEKVLNSNRLFQVVSVSGLAFYKKRWKKIYHQANYDKEIDSQFSEIILIAGPYDDLELWKGGISLGHISANEMKSKKYEKWIIWSSTNLEKRIIQELGNSDKR